MKVTMILVLIWLCKSFFTINDMVAFLNTLPEERAKEAKIFVINSQRSFLNEFSNPYYVLYRG